MPQRPDTVAERLAPVARMRREQTPVRAFVAAACAAAIAARLNHPVLWLWLAAYVAANVLEVWALAPFRRTGAASAPSRLRTGLALGSIALLASAFGSLSLLLLHAPGSLGAAAAVLLLCSGVLNVLATSRGSGEAFMAGAAPYAGLAAYVALRLGDSAVGRDPLAAMLMLAALTFMVTTGLIWRDGDRTHRRERAALHELDGRRREAEEAWEARQAFVAAVSHELRTPLGAVLAASATLEHGALAPADRAQASLITEASRLMRRLLDDLLDLAKLEAGRMAVEAVAFDPAALVRESAALWSAPAAAKGLALELEGDRALPARAVGDPMRVRQVLNNLLSNAVKFTDAGVVRLRCGIEAAADGGWDLVLDVADTGPGLSDEMLAGLFQPFAQEGPHTARLHGGSGLGLAISRELACLMGGSIAARRGPGGRGAVFTFHLRLAAAPANTAAETGRPTPDAEAPGAIRLLVVDDHPLSRRALRTLMEVAGAQVAEAAGGAEGLEMLAVQPFDLVLMDVTMPGVDGCEAVRRLRAGGGPNAAVAVLGVTGLTGTEAARTCLDAGMDGHVEKPCEPRALYAAVSAALATDAEPDALAA